MSNDQPHPTTDTIRLDFHPDRMHPICTEHMADGCSRGGLDPKNDRIIRGVILLRATRQRGRVGGW